MVRFPLALAVTCGLAVAGSAFAGGHGGNPAVKARKAHMQLYAFNLGILGAMAKGETEYNADAAAAAANNLAAVSSLNQSAYWVPGTSSEDLPEESRAKPEIWQADSKAGEIGMSFAQAAAALAAVAGDGKEGQWQRV